MITVDDVRALQVLRQVRDTLQEPERFARQAVRVRTVGHPEARCVMGWVAKYSGIGDEVYEQGCRFHAHPQSDFYHSVWNLLCDRAWHRYGLQFAELVNDQLGRAAVIDLLGRAIEQLHHELLADAERRLAIAKTEDRLEDGLDVDWLPLLALFGFFGQQRDLSPPGQLAA